MTQKCGQNETETKPKRHQTDTKTVPSDPKSTPKMVQNHPFGPKMTLIWPRMGQKWPEENRLKAIYTFMKMHKNTQNSLRILPDTHCTAHFHRLKRRF